MLVHYPCIKEDQLVEILKLDGKKVREYLMQLKAEKFVSEKLVIETTSENKQNKVLHYFINHKMTVNIIKYKLDNMRKQIELEEKQLTCRASYKCKHCAYQYNDLDIPNLINTNMRCFRCDVGEVDEDASSLPKAQSRNLLATFNTQTRPIFESLQRVEHMNLEPHILNPSPADYSGIIDGSGSRGASHQQVASSIDHSNHMWSGEKTRMMVSETPISINMSGNKNEVSLNDRIKKSIDLNNSIKISNDLIDGPTPNNSLSLLKERSIRSSSHYSSFDNNLQQVPLQQPQSLNKLNSKSLEDTIMDILIVYENKSANSNYNKNKLNGFNNGHLNGFHNNENNGNKKREFNHSDEYADSILNDLNNNHSEEDDINNNISKKRKLNGNLIIIYRIGFAFATSFY